MREKQKEFKTIGKNNNNYEVKVIKGYVDEEKHIGYSKSLGKWTATDLFSGMSVASTNSYKTIREMIDKLYDKIVSKREKMDYLKSVIMFSDLCD